MAENVNDESGSASGGGVGVAEVTTVHERQRQQREALQKEKAELIARFSALLSGVKTSSTTIDSAGTAAETSDVERALPRCGVNNNNNDDKNVRTRSGDLCNGNPTCPEDETAAPAHNGADTTSPSPSLPLTDDAGNGEKQNESARDEEVTVLQQASAVVQRHIAQLHEYNSLRDTAMALIGLLADSRGVRVVDVLNDFGVAPGSE